MKKLAFSILALGLLVISGCVKSNNTPTTTAKQSADPTTQTPEQSIETPSTQANKNPETKTTEPSFFFKSDVSQVNYQGTFMFNDIVKKEVELKINEVANPKYGKWYELKLESINGVPNDQLSLGYFYAQKDKIYKLNATEKNLNILNASKEVLIDCIIVCQDQEIKDSLNKDERGWHQYITVNGDTREFHSYNSKVETGYYETFYWEKNKGLTHFRRGYGAGRDSIELYLK